MKYFLIGWAVMTVIGLVTIVIAAKNATLIENNEYDDYDYDYDLD